LGIGNAAKDLIRLPGINNWDISLFKNFVFGREGAFRLQYRLETYNTFNHTQFGGANGTGTSIDTVARFDATGKQVNQRFGQYLASHHPNTSDRGVRDLLGKWFKEQRDEERTLLTQFKDVTGSAIKVRQKRTTISPMF